MKRDLVGLLVLNFLLVVLLGAMKSYAATINAASVSYSDVQEAVASATSGDTVVIPPGTATWSSTLVITKSLTLKGAGADKTVIKADGITTIIKVSVQGDHTIDISGLTLDANNIEGSNCLNIINTSTAPLYKIRIHHNKFTHAGYMSIRAKGNVFGLIDHNQFVDNNYDLKIYGNDRETWRDFPGLANIGTANYLYIEDNESSGADQMILASGEGARWVYRYNRIDMKNSENTVDQLFDAHGDTRNAGVVAHEIYENIAYTSGIRDATTPAFKMHDYRGGTGLIYNNTVDAGTSGVRTFINVREEYQGCTDPEGNCWDSSCGGDKVNNGYIWNNINSRDGKILAVWEGDPYDCIAEDANWWDDASHDPGGESPSNFTYGISADRPAACANNDCYWETDTKKLYRCKGDNNWVFVYSPHTYPHPLQGGAESPPPEPKNLRLK